MTLNSVYVKDSHVGSFAIRNYKLALQCIKKELCGCLVLQVLNGKYYITLTFNYLCTNYCVSIMSAYPLHVESNKQANDFISMFAKMCL